MDHGDVVVADRVGNGRIVAVGFGFALCGVEDQSVATRSEPKIPPAVAEEGVDRESVFGPRVIFLSR